MFLHADGFELPHVSVYGTSELEVAPNLMIWNLSIVSKGFEVPKVAEEQDKKLQKLLSYLRAEEIEDRDINTTRINLRENRVYRKNSYVKEGYIASTDIVFEISDLNKYRSLWIGLSTFDGLSIQSTSFDTSKRIELQNESRIKAVEVARDKAIALVNALGSQIAEPLLIEEDLSISGGWNRNVVTNNLGQVSSDADDSFSVGMIKVSTRVLVKFRITSK